MLILIALALGAPLAAPRNYDAVWASSLQKGETARLPAGRYRGPWTLGPGVHLVAEPGAILEGGNPVLTFAGANGIVENLAVQAEPLGIGIAAEGQGGIELRQVSVSGGSRGVHFRGGSLQWSGGSVEGSSRDGIWLQGCRARLEKLTLSHHEGEAIYAGHVELTATALEISGANYGILVRESKLLLSESRLEKIRTSGVSLVKGSGRITKTVFLGPFSEAAFTASGVRPLELRGLRIEKAGTMGIKLINASATLAHNEISGARSDARGLEGDGIYSNNSQLDSTGDKLSDNGGISIWVMGGRADVRRCSIRGAGQAAASASGQGRLRLSECAISDGSLELVSSSDSTLSNEAPAR